MGWLVSVGRPANPYFTQGHISGALVKITLDDDLAEAALQAAAKAGFSNVVEGLLNAGVNPDTMCGVALTIAERYGDEKSIKILRAKTTDRAILYQRAAQRQNQSSS
jgi:hypothetical protein